MAGLQWAWAWATLGSAWPGAWPGVALVWDAMTGCFCCSPYPLPTLSGVGSLLPRSSCPAPPRNPNSIHRSRVTQACCVHDTLHTANTCHPSACLFHAPACLPHLLLTAAPPSFFGSPCRTLPPHCKSETFLPKGDSLAQAVCARVGGPDSQWMQLSRLWRSEVGCCAWSLAWMQRLCSCRHLHVSTASAHAGKSQPRSSASVRLCCMVMRNCAADARA